MKNIFLIRGVFRFIYNLPSSFIEDIWGKTFLYEHYRVKFRKYCDDSGGYASAAAILWFVGSLDSENERLFYEYVENWIKTH